ncbi:hypothetical protein SAMN05216389_11831 [Oceanobacillus limi]|uniref:Uncharacterized protein n=1 Tax=Oceanobacillus limi TaxID=930131 RepID=A0A1I0G2G4_9BACI|nr:hypothetical protein [Oceanobacillus limi]SET64071.1 hypothetical protein SAMN05216389_11831 [Oceanobacillus limi]
MVSNRQTLVKSIHNIFEKLAGAGFLLSIMSLFLLLSSDVDDMYEFANGISDFFPWVVGFSLFTYVIDYLVFKFLNNRNTIKIILYMAFGYLIFMVNPMNVFMLLMGVMGLICSLILYFGNRLAQSSNIFTYGFSIVVLIPLFIIINIDFTEKEGWKEVSSSSTFEATFDNFNGKHEIPIPLREGDTLTFYTTFNNENGGGHGLYMLNENDRKIGMKERNENELQYYADQSGVYRIVIIGDDVKGSFTVNWKIE